MNNNNLRSQPSNSGNQLNDNCDDSKMVTANYPDSVQSKTTEEPISNDETITNPLPKNPAVVPEIPHSFMMNDSQDIRGERRRRRLGKLYNLSAEIF